MTRGDLSGEGGGSVWIPVDNETNRNNATPETRNFSRVVEHALDTFEHSTSLPLSLSLSLSLLPPFSRVGDPLRSAPDAKYIIM